MESNPSAKLDELLAISERLLALAGEEAWEPFNDGVDSYVLAMQALAAFDFSDLVGAGRQETASKLEKLIANDAMIIERAKARLAVLRGEMASVRKSNASAQAYLKV